MNTFQISAKIDMMIAGINRYGIGVFREIFKVVKERIAIKRCQLQRGAKQHSEDKEECHLGTLK